MSKRVTILNSKSVILGNNKKYVNIEETIRKTSEERKDDYIFNLPKDF